MIGCLFIATDQMYKFSEKTTDVVNINLN